MFRRIMMAVMIPLGAVIGGSVTLSATPPSTAVKAVMAKDGTEGAAFKRLYEKASHRRVKGVSLERAMRATEGNNAVSLKTPLRQGLYVGDGPFSLGISIVYSADIDHGIYSLNEMGEFAGLAVGEDYNATYGGVKAGGKYFVANSARVDGTLKNYNILYNASTWREITRTESAPVNTFSYAMAEDPTDGKIYGCFLTSDGEGQEFGTIDIETFERTSTICKLRESWQAAAFAEDGTLYVLLDDGSLNKVDKRTGDKTKVGNTGIPMDYLTSGVINHRDGKFYFASNTDTEWKLYAIDVATAKATAIIDFGEDIQMRGMFVGDPLAADKAPFAASTPALDFAPGALSGYVTFTAPDKLYDGSAPSGALTYRLERTGTEVASGATDWGKAERVPLTVANPGHYRITVVMHNEAGDSPASSLRVYIGNDYPAAPAEVSLERDGNKNVLAWDAVTTAQNGGYVDPSKITYSVYRYPDNTAIATGLTATGYTDIVEEPAETTVYRYAVTATFDGREGDPAISADLTLGALRLPYFEDFSTEAGAEKYKVIDANGDGLTWEYNQQNHCMTIRYSKTEQMDDWLITPPVMLEAGRSYEVSFDAIESTPRYGPEKIAAYVGTSPTVNGMTMQVVPVTVIADQEHITTKVVVKSSGAYYLGIHGCSDPDKFYPRITNIRIEDGVFDNSPDRGEMTVTPDYNGANKAVVKVTAPTHDVTGGKLDVLAKLTVTRDGTEIFEKLNPVPGESYQFDDAVPAAGYYTYGLTAYGESGAGKLLEVTNHVGMNLPGAPRNAAMTEIGNSGKVVITWDAPETDTDGNPMNPELLSYSIFDFDNDEIASYLTSLSHTYQAVAADKQAFTRFYVHAESPAGLNEMKFGVTPLTAVGTPYTLPFTETFANGTLNHLWAQGGDGDWMVIASSNAPAADPQDNDGGMLCYTPRKAESTGRFFSGKIDLGETANPAFTFFYYAVAGNSNTMDVTVRDLTAGTAATILTSIPLSEGEGWTKAVVNLAAYKGKNVEVGITCNVKDYTDDMVFDNLRVMNMIPDNLSIRDITLPRELYAGNKLSAAVTVENNGSNAASAFTVSLYANRVKVTSSEPLTLAAGKSANVTLEMTTTPFTDARLVCYAEVDYATDGDKSDNTSERTEVTVAESPYPGVTNLSGSSAAAPQMSWTAPVLTETDGAETTEDFESLPSFELNPSGKWAFVDMDGSATYSLQGIPFPNNGARMAYIVFDSSLAGLSDTYAAHSGQKYMACMAATAGANDDWMISPELNGEAQTISFWAKSYTDTYELEAFRFLTSDTGRDTGSFTRIDTKWDVPTTWTRYEFRVPAGTRYFAIECISEDSFIFMVDDVTYTPASPTAGLELKGYNVYRDTKLLAGTETAAFTDHNPVAATHTYHVTALYNKGESALSEALLLGANAISDVTADAGAKVTTHRGEIQVTVPAGMRVAIHAIDGTTRHTGTGDARVKVESGVYVVTTGNIATKVTVK
ncbi:MAG: choice-of-anchor J domain-containing protein [Candidatus Amulumruptor caecigallinarius]|nr:choice-of-anchor J domain-containing protein [Candidatus Amulumruptor caecigallinarius]MCM1396106.1 choice-of-anchor J domain-containing protein [Candidatus Amulumruptor caecigallinarius]MCM1453885.1 choice-of-anchor J domain-containing protein [bacterium]